MAVMRGTHSRIYPFMRIGGSMLMLLGVRPIDARVAWTLIGQTVRVVEMVRHQMDSSNGLVAPDGRASSTLLSASMIMGRMSIAHSPWSAMVSSKSA